MPLDLLRELVQTPSALPNERAIAELIQSKLAALGFRVTRHDLDAAEGRTNLLAETGPAGAPAICFLGHLDTVPAHPDYAANERDPHALVHDESAGVYRGLGVADMKCGLAALLSAVGDLDLKGIRVKLALTVDEEGDSAGANALVEQHAEFFEDVRLFVSCDTAVVPADDHQEQPPVRLVMARFGRVSVDLKVETHGKHGAYQAVGAGPVEVAARLLTALTDNAANANLLPQRPPMPRAGFSTRWVDCPRPSGYTSPTRCTVHIDWRLALEETPVTKHAELLTWMIAAQSRLAEGARADVVVPDRATPYATAFATSPSHPVVRPAVALHRQRFGHAEFSWHGSVSDDNIFAAAYPQVPVIGIGPAGGDLHLASEWLDDRAPAAMRDLLRELITALDCMSAFDTIWDALPEGDRSVLLALLPETGATWLALAEVMQRHGVLKDEFKDRVNKAVEAAFESSPLKGDVWQVADENVTLRADVTAVLTLGAVQRGLLEAPSRAPTAADMPDDGTGELVETTFISERNASSSQFPAAVGKDGESTTTWGKTPSGNIASVKDGDTGGWRRKSASMPAVRDGADPASPTPSTSTWGKSGTRRFAKTDDGSSWGGAASGGAWRTGGASSSSLPSEGGHGHGEVSDDDDSMPLVPIPATPLPGTIPDPRTMPGTPLSLDGSPMKQDTNRIIASSSERTGVRRAPALPGSGGDLPITSPSGRSESISPESDSSASAASASGSGRSGAADASNDASTKSSSGNRVRKAPLPPGAADAQ